VRRVKESSRKTKAGDQTTLGRGLTPISHKWADASRVVQS